MNYLSLESVSKTFGDRSILNGVTLGIDQGQKVALVGVNGSGKSTLLKIISGFETADKGEVVFRNNIVVRSLLQNPEFKPNQTVIDAVFDSEDEALKLIHDYQILLTKMENGLDDGDGLQALMDRIDALNAWDRESQIKIVLSKLGIVDFDKKVSELSGGQQKRISLAQVLIQKPDLLILDEPTNHLDIDTIEWLENYLSQQQMSLILVTHDRYFLEKVTKEIIELDLGKIFRYKGNYAHFLETKADRHEMEASEISKAKNLYRKELEWIRKMPKARGTKAKYRVDSFDDTKEKAFSGKETKNLELQAKSSRQGKKVLEIEKISHSYGTDQMVKNFSYIFKRKDRVGIVGPNGVGKTTFLKLITDELKATSGTIERGQTTKFGYYKQQEFSFKEEQTVIDFAKNIAEYITLGNGSTITVSQFLNKFLFAPEVQYKPIGKLSGGEKRRLQLLEVLIQSPNFLILDEPTNDLDLITLNTLENYLEEFDGCLILVSHDRYFMDRLVDHLFVFEGEGIISDFPGNYTDFRAQEVKSISEPKKDKDKKPEIKTTTERKKLSFKENQEFEKLEKEIPLLEAKKNVLIETLNQGSESHEQLADWSSEIEIISNQINEKEMRWLELSEL